MELPGEEEYKKSVEDLINSLESEQPYINKMGNEEISAVSSMVDTFNTMVTMRLMEDYLERTCMTDGERRSVIDGMVMEWRASCEKVVAVKLDKRLESMNQIGGSMLDMLKKLAKDLGVDDKYNELLSNKLKGSNVKEQVMASFNKSMDAATQAIRAVYKF